MQLLIHLVSFLLTGQLVQAVSWTVGQAVNTSSGMASGHAASNFTQVSEYLGIPYAQPPLGKLRFQPPVKYTGSTSLSGNAFVSLDSNICL